MKVLENNMIASQKCRLISNGNTGFGIWEGEYKHVVDLKSKPFSCKLWMLNELHALMLCAMFDRNLNIEDFV